MDVGEEVVQPLAHIDLSQFAASHKGVDDGSVLGGIMVCRKDSSYAPKPYCNLFSHGELGSAGLDGLYKEVTEQIGKSVDDEEMKLCTREGIKSNEIDIIVKYN